MNSKERDDCIFLGWTRRYPIGVVFAATFASLLAFDGRADAQTMTPITPFVKRSPDTDHNAPTLQWDINRKECENDDKFTFGFTIAGWMAKPPEFEVYGTIGGVNCMDDTVRNTTPSQCFKMAVETPPNPGANSASISFTAQDLAKYAGLSSCSDTSATYINFDIFFMFLKGTNIQGMGVPWQMKTHIDLIGPNAPTKITVTGGDASLDVTATGTGETNGSTVYYCALNGSIVDTSVDSSSNSGSGGTGGAGGSGGANSSGGAGGAANCVTAPLVAGELPDVNWKPCGTGATIPKLQNDVTYAVAAAFTDNLGNTGPLSPVECGTTAPVDDFFEIYDKNGGAAGGGFCSISSGTRGATSFGGSFVLGALAFVVRRRARASRRFASQEVSK